MTHLVCLATTETIVDVASQLLAKGFRVDLDGDNPHGEQPPRVETSEVVEAFEQSSGCRIYFALRKGLPDESDTWIVRCHPDYFERPKQRYLNIQGENDE